MTKSPKIITSVVEMRDYSRMIPMDKAKGFVPTMGCLHQGHLSLVQRSVNETDITIVSIFVNPIQFGVGEDYDKYPRNIANDIELLSKAGVDVIFIPEVKEMFPDTLNTFVYGTTLINKYCGKSRPGHFKGVMTIVAKLLNIITPDMLYLGEKDFQQYFILKRMIADLNFPTYHTMCKTVRKDDGLAMSSRNNYLTDQERADATCLYKSLILAKKLFACGETKVKTYRDQIKDLIKKHNGKIDYIAFIDQNTFEAVKKITKETRVLLAVKIGTTRLIDNMKISG